MVFKSIVLNLGRWRYRDKILDMFGGGLINSGSTLMQERSHICDSQCGNHQSDRQKHSHKKEQNCSQCWKSLTKPGTMLIKVPEAT